MRQFVNVRRYRNELLVVSGQRPCPALGGIARQHGTSLILTDPLTDLRSHFCPDSSIGACRRMGRREKREPRLRSTKELHVTFVPVCLMSRARARCAFADICAAVLVCLLATLTFSQESAAQSSKVVATYGAWQINCGTPPGSKNEKCAAVQSVAAEDRPDVGLTVIFLKSADGAKNVLRVVAPLGVLLPRELGLKVDNVDIGRVKYQQCGRVGCLAQVDLSADLENKLKAGQQAIFIIFQTQEAGIGIPISLDGLEKALSSIK